MQEGPLFLQFRRRTPDDVEDGNALGEGAGDPVYCAELADAEGGEDYAESAVGGGGGVVELGLQMGEGVRRGWNLGERERAFRGVDGLLVLLWHSRLHCRYCKVGERTEGQYWIPISSVTVCCRCSSLWIGVSGGD